jgi:hypothetical protein
MKTGKILTPKPNKQRTKSVDTLRKNRHWADGKAHSSRRWRNHKGELALLAGDKRAGQGISGNKGSQMNAAMRESRNKREKISAATEQHTKDPVAEVN